MIDNIEKIISLLEFEKEGLFQILILKRKKDFDDKSINNQKEDVRLIKDYYFKSKEELLGRYEEMKILADATKSRVYINLNSKNISNIGLQMINTISEKLLENSFKFTSVYRQTYAECETIKPKYWVVDIDYKNVSDNEILRVRTCVNDCSPDGDNIIGDIPTPNGIHLITRPFNLAQFMLNQDVYYKVEVKKNNPTILYSNIK